MLNFINLQSKYQQKIFLMKSYYFLLLTILTALLPFSSLKCENQLQILSVNTEDYPEAIFVEFTVKGDNNNFVKDLGPNDFAFYDNGTRKFGCLQMMEDLSSIKQSYDIIFLVDNSGSMQTPQEKLNQTIPNLVDSLSKKGNVRASLIRFGQSPLPEKDCGLPVYKDNKFFFDLSNPIEKELFKTDIWNENDLSGGWELYYAVLEWAAIQDFPYNKFATKVFILIGDEAVVDEGNNYNCERTETLLIGQADIANILKENNIQTFIIQNTRNYEEFSTITTKTGGGLYNISADNYNGMIDSLSQSVQGRYIVRYCLDEENPNETCQDTRETVVEFGDVIARTTYRPVASATIKRSDLTQRYDSLVINEGDVITLEIEVNPNGNIVDSALVFYKNNILDKFDSIFVKTPIRIDENKNHYFTFSLPQDIVKGNKLIYGFDIFTHTEFNGRIDKSKVSSPAYHNNEFYWNIAISPNRAPLIKNVQYDSVLPCRDINISATINSGMPQCSIISADLYYRIKNTPSLFTKVEMSIINEEDNIYNGTITSGFSVDKSIEYYIIAKNDVDLYSYYGNASEPNIININQFAVGSRKNPMKILFPLDHITMDCKPISTKDTILAYYTSKCDEQEVNIEAGIGLYHEFLNAYLITIYGNSSIDSSRKNGFDEGEYVQLKLIQNGVDYILDNYEIKYSSTAEIITAPNISIGPNVPKLGVYLNKQELKNDNIDFGECSEKKVDTLTIKNIGCEKLIIGKIEVSNPYFDFIIKGHAVNDTIILNPEEEKVIEISYLPVKDAYGKITFHTNIPQSHRYDIILEGKSLIKTLCSDVIIYPSNPIKEQEFKISFPHKEDTKLQQQSSCNNSIITHSYELAKDILGKTDIREYNITLSQECLYKFQIIEKNEVCEFIIPIK